MNIAIFTNNYLPNPYGVSTSIETFRKEFERIGHQVYIFAPNWPGYHDLDEQIYRYPSINIEVKFKFPLAIPFSRRISQVLQELELDVIHSQHPNLLGNTARKWAKKKNIPLVFTWHTLYDRYTNFVPFIPPRIAAKYMISGAVSYANRADAVVVPTDSIISELRRWGVTKTMTPVATGVVEEEFCNASRTEIRKKYDIGENEVLILSVSRLTGEKNIEFVLRSLTAALKDNANIKLIVAGDGYLLPELKAFCVKEGLDKKVIFPGLVSREDIKNYYAAADIFVYGSKSETQGMILTEAMYMGLPIVALAATGTNSLVLNNGNGFLVREDEKEFGYAVTKLVLDRDLREKLSQVSRNIAKSFTSRVCADKLLKVYEEAIEKHKKK